MLQGIDEIYRIWRIYCDCIKNIINGGGSIRESIYQIPWNWVPLQILGMGNSIWIMATAVLFLPGHCLPGGACNLTIYILLQAIGFVIFVLSGYSLMKMNFGPLIEPS